MLQKVPQNGEEGFVSFERTRQNNRRGVRGQSISIASAIILTSAGRSVNGARTFPYPLGALFPVFLANREGHFASLHRSTAQHCKNTDGRYFSKTNAKQTLQTKPIITFIQHLRVNVRFHKHVGKQRLRFRVLVAADIKRRVGDTADAARIVRHVQLVLVRK